MLQSIEISRVKLHQAVYRKLLTAMSRPGSRCPLPTDLGADPLTLIRVVLETLIDHEVTFSVFSQKNSPLDADCITGWTHARVAPLETADFLIVQETHSNGCIRNLKRGTAEMPDTGATAIYQLPAEPNLAIPKCDVRISGPGISPSRETILKNMGLAASEWQAIREINQEFPMGVDVFLILPDVSVIGLPRSAAIKEISPWPT